VNHTIVTAGYGSGAAARTSDSATMIAYFPNSTSITVDLSKIAGTRAQAWWYDPTNGSAAKAGTFATSGSRNFNMPSAQDWVLVLDDSARGFMAPGTPMSAVGPQPALPNGPTVFYLDHYPNPLTVSALMQLEKQNGLRIYDLSGAPIERSSIRENGIYFVGTEVQTARKVLVIK
jgi:hypothetical protein